MNPYRLIFQRAGPLPDSERAGQQISCFGWACLGQAHALAKLTGLAIDIGGLEAGIGRPSQAPDNPASQKKFHGIIANTA